MMDMNEDGDGEGDGEGYLVLKGEESTHRIESVIPVKVLEVIRPRNLNSDVSIRFQEWGSLDYPSYLQMIEKWRVRHLWLDNNQTEQIIPQISHIHFPNLLWLSLASNNLATIQNLSKVHLPQLAGIMLSNNPITTIRSLRKCLWGRLNGLYIYDVFVEQWDVLSQCLFDTQGQEKCVLSINKSSMKSFTCLLKIEAGRLKPSKNNRYGIYKSRKVRAMREIEHTFQKRFFLIQ